MLGEVRIDHARQFLRLDFAPQAALPDWQEGREALARLAQETGIRRALIDVRRQASSVRQTPSLYTFAAELPADMAFAVLTTPSRDDHAFVETVAQNRGKKVRLFFGPEEEAIEWLARQFAA
jgi:hypothetical protein